MKELSIEEKAKRYDEALKLAKDSYNYPSYPGFIRADVVFPELKESEDEQSKKWILEYLYDGLRKADEQFKGQFKTAIAWLEKQGGNPAPININKMVMKYSQTKDGDFGLPVNCQIRAYRQGLTDAISTLNLKKQGDTNETINKDEFAQGVLGGAAINLITWIDYNAAEGNMCLSNMECKDIEGALVSGDWDKIYTYIKKKLEKQDEQKPFNYENANIQQKDFAPKQETKFREGDWIVFNGLTLYVKEVVKGFYRTISKGGIPNSYDWDIDNIARLWNITDAKDGDVLVDVYGNIGIFQKNDDFDWSSYCSLGSNGGFRCFAIEHELDGSHPATKEQRDLLFQKMAENGYAWDTEKKETKLLISNGGDFEPELSHKEVTKKCDKDSKLSEEDEDVIYALETILDILINPEAGIGLDEVQGVKNETMKSWLKSLKDRVRPQPKQDEWSDEDKEMKDLIDEISCHNDDVDYETHVRIMRWLNELKQRLS